jgi:D-serine deaminase-like pyridoxal phosphate-dependent protein
LPFFVFYTMKFERPTYLINPDICKDNIRQMASKASRSGVAFRPHFKTHQSLVIGRWFRDAGITKITVSSLGAAEYFANDGWNDITVAFPVNLREIDLINHLASRIRIGLLLEHPSVALELDGMLNSPVDAYIKIDTGLNRTGLKLDEMPLIAELAATMRASSNISLKGLLTHAGHTYRASSPGEIMGIYQSSTRILTAVKENLGSSFSDLIISYGDTPSCSVMESFADIDEIRPGNFIFYDLMQFLAGTCSFKQIAGVIVCPVVAVHPERNQAVIYGGAIHFSKDYLEIDGRRVYGQLVEMDEQGWHGPVPGARLVALSQEHGIIEASDQLIGEIKPGRVVGIVPVHSCLTANLMRGYQFPDGQNGDYFF